MRKSIAVFTAALLLAGCSQVNGAGPGSGPGYGPGYGPGMMGGYGPGMMGGGYGMTGPGMMGGYGYGYGGRLPDLTAEQRAKVAEIQREQRARQWPLMQQMHELMWADAQDEETQRRDYDKLAVLQKQMFESHLETRKRIDAVLTPQQREELRRGWTGPR